MALTGLDGTFAQVNDSLAEMLGYTIDELTGLGVQGVTHPDDLAVDIASAQQLLVARSSRTSARSAISARTARSSGAT